ncbi:MAG: sugar ABC transporter permease [Candidatus Pristimantibacillus lignocellulolyticus]|uniref:Sugar ABC transporter permease n=1 Tax=Candidatus Pristimantibacillus lignocellulolyticus TaxID=2994561 RepID=A0A9J6ZFY9_9BACL|nr:MAG: sugar ABC transporter permease [Candidatus Pristimantibacillus lignocellulolyticus]
MKLKGISLYRKRSMLGFFFIGPWLIGFLFLYLTPLIQSVKFSFTKLEIQPEGYSLLSVGWENFRNAVFVDANFNRILTSSVWEMILSVPMILFFSLFSATLLNQKFRGRTLTRAIFFLPVILASNAIEAAEKSGLINLIGSASYLEEMQGATSSYNVTSIVYTLLDIGIPLTFADYIVTAILSIYSIITSSGVQILIFLAALQSVPNTMYEVAKMEGATAYESFWKITFPMISPLILTNIIYTVIDSFSGSPITTLIYSTAFTSQNFGLSAAMSWIYTIVVAGFLAIIGVVLAKRIHYN